MPLCLMPPVSLCQLALVGTRCPRVMPILGDTSRHMREHFLAWYGSRFWRFRVVHIGRAEASIFFRIPRLMFVRYNV